MNKIKYILASACAAVLLSGCSGFLDQEPDNIYTEDQVFSDQNMILSVLANLYGRVNYGLNLNDTYPFTYIDEVAKMDGGPDYLQTFNNDLFRVYDYGFIRNCNQFLEGLKGTDVMKEDAKKPLEGEVRFLRAWAYFNMVRSLGGVPLVGDEVMTYDSPDDVPAMTKARATEAETYDYIISECRAAADIMSASTNTHSARANKWTALMLEARAAVYAGSLANYNNKMASPIRTQNGEVGIPADRAAEYYKTALAAAKEVMANSPYKLQDDPSLSKGENFYNAVCIKDNNTEVMWCHDYYYPGSTVSFSNANIPSQFKDDIDNSYAGPTLNMVEQFEPLDTDKPGERAAFKTKNADGSYVFYPSSSAPFEKRDPRLYGSVLYPGGKFRNTPCELQAGQLRMENGQWKIVKGTLGSTDENGQTLTSMNGPLQSNQQFINKTGFYFRKFLDEKAGSSMRGGNRSTMWWPYFRISEAYMIACEASFELGNTSDALTYINAVRARAGVQPLKSITFSNIVHENAVEFAFEFHRWWDLKRWRLADKVFNGDDNSVTARHRSLWPYRVVAPGNEHDGQWVFVEDKYFMSPNARYFQMRNYYNFIDDGWRNSNPLLVKNPYQ
ncbi:MAG: RagB/SusD family nutrient uptake outer membrane protein [Prevotella sp.]|jgi:hypothetical protein